MALSHNSRTKESEPQWGSWLTTNRSKLPNGAFADREGRRFPHHFVVNGAGEDSEGRWTSGEMFLHVGGLNAAFAAAKGARTGRKAEPAIVSHLESHRRAIGRNDKMSDEIKDDDLKAFGGDHPAIFDGEQVQSLSVCRDMPACLGAHEVDRKKKKIKGVSIATLGEARGHGFGFDETSLNQIISLGNEQNKGVKVRFAHPSLVNDGLGNFLGRMTNFRLDEESEPMRVRADFELSETAFDTPNGNLGDYVLRLANDEPEAFATSPVIRHRTVMRIGPNGEQITDENGEPSLPVSRIRQLRAVDVVDQGAVNEGLFGENDSRDEKLDELETQLVSLQERINAMAEQTKEPTNEPTGELQDKPDIAKLLREGAADALREENKRRTEIRKECAKHGLEAALAEAIVDEAVDLSAAKGMILDKLADQPNLGLHIEVGKEGKDKHIAALGSALTHRALSESGIGTEAVNEALPEAKRAEGYQDFANASLLDVAKECLAADGVRTRGLAARDIALTAMGFDNASLSMHSGAGWHSTGSFPNLTRDAVNKTMLASFTERTMTWQTVFRRAASVDDFKTIRRVRMSEAQNLDAWPTDEDPKQMGFGDEEETYAVEAHANLASFTWDVIVNDDLDALSRIPQQMGVAAARTINARAWAIITANANLSDGQPLFSNVAGNRQNDNLAAAAAISAIALGDMRRLMRLMVGVNQPDGTKSQAILNLTPKFLVVPAALETIARNVIQSEFDVVANIFQGVNQFGNLTIVTEPLLDANSAIIWYLFADTRDVDTVEVTFLRGEETPRLTQFADPKTLALTHRIQQTFNAKAIDHRGMIQNPGL